LLDLSTLDHIPEKEVIDIIKEYKMVLNESGVLVVVFWYNSLLGGLKRKVSSSIRISPKGDMACQEPMIQYYFH